MLTNLRRMILPLPPTSARDMVACLLAAPEAAIEPRAQSSFTKAFEFRGKPPSNGPSPAIQWRQSPVATLYS
jgi:hypothetical protein